MTTEPRNAFIFHKDKMSETEIKAMASTLNDMMKRGVCERVEYIPISEFQPKDPPKPKKARKSAKAPQEPDSTQKYLAKRLYNRRESTLWSKAETDAYNDIKARYGADIDLKSDIELLARYYDEIRRKGGDEDISRRDLQTLLNNWNGEMDRARAYRFPAGKRAAFGLDEEPEGWVAFMAEKLGHDDFIKDCYSMTASLKAEIIKEMEGDEQ